MADAELAEQEKAKQDVKWQEMEFQMEKTVNQVKEFGASLTQLSNFVNTELLKLKELLGDKSLKKSN